MPGRAMSWMSHVPVLHSSGTQRRERWAARLPTAPLRLAHPGPWLPVLCHGRRWPSAEARYGSPLMPHGVGLGASISLRLVARRPPGRRGSMATLKPPRPGGRL